jgi:endonuclease/exonuclease/phosphatase family metal-dependent hydrolase
VTFSALALFLGARCSLPWEVREPRGFTIVSYNAHNLFDDRADGGEYPEFIPGASGWSSDLYNARLDNTAFAACAPFRLEAVQRDFPWPDILCLVEIEGEKVLRDLAQGPMAKASYRWLAVGEKGASATRCGILSRYPIVACRSHSLVDAWGFGPFRDILEAEIGLGISGGAVERVTLFLCHWKSRKEGARDTEGARREAARMLSRRIREIKSQEPGRLVVVCGDFNENPDEFLRAGKEYPTAFSPLAPQGDPSESGGIIEVCGSRVLAGEGQSSPQDRVVLFSPWEEAGGFSYIFQGEEERLDGFLLSPASLDGKGLEYGDFFVGALPELLDQEGRPSGWNGKTGFSDHLPIGLRLFSSLYD